MTSAMDTRNLVSRKEGSVAEWLQLPSTPVQKQTGGIFDKLVAPWQERDAKNSRITGGRSQGDETPESWGCDVDEDDFRRPIIDAFTLRRHQTVSPLRPYAAGSHAREGVYTDTIRHDRATVNPTTPPLGPTSQPESPSGYSAYSTIYNTHINTQGHAFAANRQWNESMLRRGTASPPQQSFRKVSSSTLATHPFPSSYSTPRSVGRKRNPLSTGNSSSFSPQSKPPEDGSPRSSTPSSQGISAMSPFPSSSALPATFLDSPAGERPPPSGQTQSGQNYSSQSSETGQARGYADAASTSSPSSNMSSPYPTDRGRNPSSTMSRDSPWIPRTHGLRRIIGEIGIEVPNYDVVDSLVPLHAPMLSPSSSGSDGRLSVSTSPIVLL